MKVGIIGNYGHNNNGDEAILSGLLHQLTTFGQVDKEDIVVFSNTPSNTESRHGVKAVPLLYKEGSLVNSALQTIRKSRRVMKELDLLIIGGGGLLMDMYKRDAPLYSVLGLTGKYSGCRVAVHGVGAGPINTKAGMFFIKKLVNASFSTAVRDEKSKKLLQDIGVQKDIDVIYDPAFSVPVQKPHVPTDQIKRIGVTAVPYFSDEYWPTPDSAKYDAYVRGMASSLDWLISNKNIQVTFFSTKFPEDVKVTVDIAAKMEYSQSVHIIEDNLPPEKIIKVAAAQDMVIGTRLHSLILSVNAKTPVIGVEYHKKVKDFMQMMDKNDYSVAIDELLDQEHGIVSAFERAENNWNSLQTNIASVSNDLRHKANEGMKLLGF
ncbi:polysaccharide pyruvyl transferase CsaB [Alteribacillus persepolensis]|uniref:Polysaccharide pyruvyl transferase CsaB n=1 Tax=Alteribacillus persepolensis TaxID=568899 RepID=A0A1G8AD02_9BACI|nr:polysaccharide pyruvyl transferase family protein [Alteribacillus persepolensis]SDH18771.1 polysaccharide pyruvyl transferase CsaB [Alteribacillus persepolensis]